MTREGTAPRPHPLGHTGGIRRRSCHVAELHALGPSCVFIMASYCRMGINVPRLILLVKQQPSIWNVNHPKYRDRHSKNDIWKHICKTLYPEWNTLTPWLKKQIGKDVRNRWRSVRDQFRKYENDLGKRGSLPPKRKTSYSDILQFLHTGRELRQTEGNIPTQESVFEDSNPLPSSGSGQDIATSQDVTDGQAGTSSPVDAQPSTSAAGPQCQARARVHSKSNTCSLMPTAMGCEALNMIESVEKEDHWDHLGCVVAERIRQLPESRQWVSVPPMFELLNLFGKPHPIPDNAEILLTLKHLFEKHNNSNIGVENYCLNTVNTTIGQNNTRMAVAQISQSLEMSNSSHMQGNTSSRVSFMELRNSTPLQSPGITQVSLTAQFSQLYEIQSVSHQHSPCSSSRHCEPLK
ncbi:uncharacterized protein [Dendropsophus ebraccatus]|uniref:uncharacterized protein isoform X3 n=1 Tax=Dendropsophus ebraccatus TaxID=150705 RepID=UPI0038317729